MAVDILLLLHSDWVLLGQCCAPAAGCSPDPPQPPAEVDTLHHHHLYNTGPGGGITSNGIMRNKKKQMPDFTFDTMPMDLLFSVNL